MKTSIPTILAIGVLALGVRAVVAQSGDDLFQQALVKERTEGNLPAAIALYQTIVEKHGTDRALAVKALMQMAQCYEKLRQSDALKVYERVAHEFGDQPETAAVARRRLAALIRPETEVTLPRPDARRVIWSDASLRAATISPDGNHLVYVSPGRMGPLYVRDLRSGLNRRLTVPDSENDPGRPNGRLAFSPDGKLIAYGWQVKPGADPSMRLISLDGTRSRVPQKRDEPMTVVPHYWSSDGNQILGLGKAPGRNGLAIALFSVGDGSVHVLREGIDTGNQISRMTLSRDGRYVAYDSPARDKAGERDIFILDVAGGQERRLVSRAADDRAPLFTPDGQGIAFVSARPGPDEMWFLRVVDGKPQGPPELLNLDVGSVLDVGSIIGFTKNGSFAYADAPRLMKLFAATLDPTGTIIGQPAVVSQRPLAMGSVVGWSPDGQFLAYPSSRASALGPIGENVIVIRTIESGIEREIAPGFRGWGWSPDGRSILADGTDKREGPGLYRVDARTGAGALLLPAKPGETVDRPNWFLGGKSIVFIRRLAGGAQIVSRNLATGVETELYRPPPSLSIGSSLEVSADGQRLAFVLQHDQEAAPTMSVMVMTAVGGRPRELGGFRWKYPETIIDIAALTPDGKNVLFTTGDVEQPYLGPTLWQIGVDGSGLREIKIQKEFAVAGRAVFHPDGKQFAFAVLSGRQSVWMADNFLPKAAGAR